MTLTVDPAEPALHHSHLVVNEEPRRQQKASPGGHDDGPAANGLGFDAAAPVSLDPDTGAAVADLHAVDAVPLAIALSRYGEAE